MDKIRIVTDSTADLPEEIINKYKIKVIPLSFIIDGKVYMIWWISVARNTIAN